MFDCKVLDLKMWHVTKLLLFFLLVKTLIFKTVFCFCLKALFGPCFV